MIIVTRSGNFLYIYMPSKIRSRPFEIQEIVWSLCISTRYQIVFARLGLKRVDFALTDNTVVFKVDIGRRSSVAL